MIKFVVVLAMLTLIGFSSISAAAIDLGDELSEPIKDFEGGLKRMLQDVSQQIKENADFDEYTDFDSFLEENRIDDEDGFMTEEREEFPADETSALEDDRSGDDAGAGISCAWHGRVGHCCQKVIVIRVRLSICLLVMISPPTGMHIILKLNGVSIWRHYVTSKHNYRVCLTKGHLRLCVLLYHLYVSAHSASACLHFDAKYRFIHVRKNLGCFARRFADDKISMAKKTPLVKSAENQKEVPKETKQSNDVLRFDQ